MRDYGNTVLRTAAAVTGNGRDAEDIFSEVYFALYRYRDGFLSNEHLKAWLIRVTVNKAKNVKKSAYERHRAGLTENIPSRQSGFEDTEYVLAALKKLKPVSRAVIYLHYYEGYNLKEIADIMYINENSLRSVIARARDELKQILSE